MQSGWNLQPPDVCSRTHSVTVIGVGSRSFLGDNHLDVVRKTIIIKKATGCFELIQEAVSQTRVVVRSLAFYLTNHAGHKLRSLTDTNT